jgi:hypothetical protein
MNSWTKALQEYNKGKISSIPKKGTLEYEKVKKIQQKYNVKGAGLKDTFGSVIDKVYSGLDSLLPQAKNSIPLFPGERHGKKIKDGEIISYNWLGPNTKVSQRLARGDKGIDKLDELARQHDLSYTLVFKKKLQKGIKVSKAEVQRVDKVFVDGVNQNKSENPILARIIPPIFQAKKIAQDMGVLHHTAFFYLKTGDGMKSTQKSKKIKVINNKNVY